MSESPLPVPRVPVRPGPAAGYTPLVPTFSPYTSDAGGAVRLAWRVLLGAFAVLVALVVGVPLARNWYVNAAVEPQGAQIMPVDGVVFLRRLGTTDWLAARTDEHVVPGDELRTAQNARAFVTLFDQSTVLVYPSSTLRVLRAEQGRFRRDRRTTVLELSQGRARLGVSPAPDPEGAFFQLRTPQAEVHLTEGSYSADVTRDVTQISTRFGEATAHGAAGSAAAHAGQRLTVAAGQAPVGAQPPRRDLLLNGYFADREGTQLAGWAARINPAEVPPDATISFDARPGAVTFRRAGQAGHSETFLSQTLDVDLWDYERVVLAADVRVLAHTLSGGGWEGSEYPLMLRVTYRDAEGNSIPWYRGYYLHNRDNNPVRGGYGHGEALPSTDWQHVEIDLLGESPRPWRIQKVEVIAQGLEYESAIREFHIWAE